MAATEENSDAAERERLDLSAIEKRWQKAWQQRKVHEAHPEPDREKFFLTYPYSYMNAYAHVGHAYTMLRCDFMARFQRMLGKNVLFPFAYHVTGTPIVAAANRIREGEETQIQQLIDQGIPEEDVERFSDPIKWVEFFPQQWRQDVDRLGLAIDWRRQFYTTDMNPFYDSFIRWQFRRLKDMGYVRRGRHPVVWDPVEGEVLSDHDRVEGEGVTPQEFTLIKLRSVRDPSRVFVAATLRPETMFGQTNVWVHPDEVYTELEVGDERWVVAKQAVEKFVHQFDDAEPTGQQFPGSDLVGLELQAPATERTIPVLPATFVSASTGTGVVTSVPSDAPYDMIALEDLRRSAPDVLERYGLDPTVLDRVEPIPIIDTPELGDLPALAVLEDLGIERQDDQAKLEQATDIVYKRGFYGGTMKPELPQIGGEGVQAAKEQVKAWLIEQGEASTFYELPDPVVSRGLNNAVVRVVDDQWFLAYGEESWKADVRRAFDETIRCYPDKVRTQFDNVVDWLNDWACARASGLGTHLPWDEQWIIESLSDSTIYMAYYTIAHLLEDSEIQPEDIQDNDAAFDYIFLGKGSPSEAANGELTEELLEQMRQEFTYWYPLDFRNSGKDLVQNHLTFMVYNHVALFPEEHWPRGISVNGWVTIDGDKMSKSAGNFVTLRESLEAYGATATRVALANAGEGLDDANFDREFAGTVSRRLETWFRAVTERPDDARKGELTTVDVWMLARLSELSDEARQAYAEARFRSALKASLFDLLSAWRRYQRRCLGEVHEEVWGTLAAVGARMLGPIAPHLASQAWETQGHDGLLIDAPFPELEAPREAEQALAGEALVEQVLGDTRDILKATGQDPELVRIFTAPSWKQTVVETALELEEQGALNPGSLTGRVMQDPEVKAQGGEAAKFAKQIAVDIDRGHRPVLGVDEQATLEQASGFLANELGCKVELYAADQAAGIQDGGKAARAEPGRPGIYVEGAGSVS